MAQNKECQSMPVPPHIQKQQQQAMESKSGLPLRHDKGFVRNVEMCIRNAISISNSFPKKDDISDYDHDQSSELWQNKYHTSDAYVAYSDKRGSYQTPKISDSKSRPKQILFDFTPLFSSNSDDSDKNTKLDSRQKEEGGMRRQDSCSSFASLSLLDILQTEPNSTRLDVSTTSTNKATAAVDDTESTEDCTSCCSEDTFAKNDLRRNHHFNSSLLLYSHQNNQKQKRERHSKLCFPANLLGSLYSSVGAINDQEVEEECDECCIEDYNDSFDNDMVDHGVNLGNDSEDEEEDDVSCLEELEEDDDDDDTVSLDGRDPCKVTPYTTTARTMNHEADDDESIECNSQCSSNSSSSDTLGVDDDDSVQSNDSASSSSSSSSSSASLSFASSNSFDCTTPTTKAMPTTTRIRNPMFDANSMNHIAPPPLTATSSSESTMSPMSPTSSPFSPNSPCIKPSLIVSVISQKIFHNQYAPKCHGINQPRRTVSKNNFNGTGLFPPTVSTTTTTTDTTTISSPTPSKVQASQAVTWAHNQTSLKSCFPNVHDDSNNHQHCRLTNNNRKEVQFYEYATVRDYALTMGAFTWVTDACPLQLSWEHGPNKLVPLKDNVNEYGDNINNRRTRTSKTGSKVVSPPGSPSKPSTVSLSPTKNGSGSPVRRLSLAQRRLRLAKVQGISTNEACTIEYKNILDMIKNTKNNLDKALSKIENDHQI